MMEAGVAVQEAENQGDVGERMFKTSDSDSSASLKPIEKVRTEFPETWIWQNDISRYIAFILQLFNYST